MYNFTRFSLKEMTECGTTLRKLGMGVVSLEAVANKLVDYFYNHFLDPDTNQPALALVRCFKTHAYGELPPDLQQIANRSLGTVPPQPTLKCLTLLATAGDRPEWNDRRQSTGHQVIPLVSEQMVTQAPMISQLIQQLGLTINDVIAPSPDVIMNLHERTYNVFHIPEAIGSPHIPAQAEFVQPFQIRSVLGFGSVLPSGNFTAMILFSKLPIRRETAELFKPLALNTKMAMLPFDQGELFASTETKATSAVMNRQHV